MTNCNRQNCQEPGKWACKINIPAEGWAINSHQPLSMMIGLEVCDTHFTEIKIEDFLTDDLKELAEKVLEGKQPPDFARAWMSRISINSPEFKKFKSQVKSND